MAKDEAFVLDGNGQRANSVGQRGGPIAEDGSAGTKRLDPLIPE